MLLYSISKTFFTLVPSLKKPIYRVFRGGVAGIFRKQNRSGRRPRRPKNVPDTAPSAQRCSGRRPRRPKGVTDAAFGVPTKIDVTCTAYYANCLKPKRRGKTQPIFISHKFVGTPRAASGTVVGTLRAASGTVAGTPRAASATVAGTPRAASGTPLGRRGRRPLRHCFSILKLIADAHGLFYRGAAFDD
jgi:hypothetical protein